MFECKSCVYCANFVVVIFIAPSMPPLDLVVSNLEPRSFHADWAPPPIEATNGILRKYTVNIIDLNSGAERIIETHNTSLKIHNAHPHTVYSVSVSAFTVRSGPSVTLEILTPQDGMWPLQGRS